jgi:hypothetical protein
MLQNVTQDQKKFCLFEMYYHNSQKNVKKVQILANQQNTYIILYSSIS